MHTLSCRGTPLASFQLPEIEALAKVNLWQITADGWRELENVFKSMNVMASGTRIVGNSKVLAHLCPNLVAPIDREYTLQYLRGKTTVTNGKDCEWLLFEEILRKFFAQVYDDSGFQASAEKWLSNQKLYAWDTSHLKIIDNLLIGARKWSQRANSSKSEPER